MATHPQHGEASGYLLKPFEEPELTSLLHKIIIEKKAALLKRRLYEKRLEELEEFITNLKTGKEGIFSRIPTE